MSALARQIPLQALGSLDILYNQGLFEEMLQRARALALQFPDSGELQIRLGNAYAALRRFDSARTSFEAALRQSPRNAGIHYNLGNMLRVLGDFDGAAKSYSKAIRLNPDFAPAHFNLSSLKTYRKADPQIRAMRELLKRPGLPKQGEMALHFALGKAYADCGDPDRAFAHFDRGNKAQRAIKPYDREAQHRLFAEIRACFEPDGVPEAPSSPAPDRRPIFIVGMLRSGTTLVERILGAHSQVHACGELGLAPAAARKHLGPRPGAITAEKMGAFRNSYAQGLARLGAEAPVLTDKLPHNFLWTGFLLRAMPEAHIVHVIRDPRATCWSMFSHCFTSPEGGYDNDLGDLADFYRHYAELMALWHRLFPGRILDLNYERLTEDQEAETRRLLDYCDLGWEAACLDFHKAPGPLMTASGPQVVKPLYQGSSDVWRSYEHHLGPLLSGLPEVTPSPAEDSRARD